jgi:hypothetical protein
MGYRVYIIEGDAVSPVKQKTFHDFLFREERTLRAYSGRTVTFAMAFYETENRRPVRIVRLDTLRLTVKQDGSLDQDEYRRHLMDTLAALDSEVADPLGAKKPRENRSPKISDQAYRNILADLKIPGEEEIGV